jgi:hypothetical protein
MIYMQGSILLDHSMSFSGVQIVDYIFPSRNEYGVCVLKSTGEIETYEFSVSDGGFIASDLSSRIIDAINGNVTDEAIVEIAGGDSIKLRFQNGQMISAVELQDGAIVTSEDFEVGRVTKNKTYKFKYKFYKSGPGTSPIVPLLEDDIVSVFEGDENDFVVRLGDLGIGDTIVGKWADDVTITESTEGQLTIHYGEADLDIDDFGEIKLVTKELLKIKLRSANKNCLVGFPKAQQQYIDAHGKCSEISWFGVGRVGHVVDFPVKYIGVVDVPVPGASAVSTIRYIKKGHRFMTLNESNEFVEIDTITLNGEHLIEHIYNNNMANTVPLASLEGEEFEPFNANGFFFSYRGNRWESVDVSSL